MEPEEFAKAIEKIGIMIPTKQDLDALFNIYDVDRSGALDYKEFATGLFGKEVSMGGGSPQKGGGGGSSGPTELVEKLRTKLASRGARGIIGLGKQFRIMDDNNSRSLDTYEFNKAMKDYMLGFNDSELRTLFQYFDMDRSGTIDYDEFMRAIKGPMNANRKKFVAQAYNKLDKDKNGYIDINDIKGVYNGSKHPDVLQGKKTEEQILMEFLETFETHHSMRNNSAPDHIVTKEEFDEYYNNISASIDNDQYFELMMNNAWKLNEADRSYSKGWSNKDTSPSKTPAQQYSKANGAGGARGGQVQSYSRPQTGYKAQGQSNSGYPGAQQKQGGSQQPPMNMSEKQLMDQFRQKIAARGARGIVGLGKKFKIADDNNSKDLDLQEFKKACHDFRIGVNDKDVERLYKIFDRDQSGSIDYDEFLRGVRGEMN